MRQCITCAHPKRREIDALLATGTTAAEVGRMFEIGERSVRRHADAHLPASVVQAAQESDEARNLNVSAEVKRLYWRTIDILDSAENDKVGLAAIHEARPILELVGKLQGDLDERAQVNVLINPQWTIIRSVIFEALLPFPEAAQAVAAALLRTENAVSGE